MFVKVIGAYVNPGLALLLDARDSPEDRAAAVALLEGARARVCALGCTLTAVFSYADVVGCSS